MGFCLKQTAATARFAARPSTPGNHLLLQPDKPFPGIRLILKAEVIILKTKFL